MIIILLKINLFLPWYSWKVAELAFSNNHSLAIRNQYILNLLYDVDNMKAWLGNMLMPSIIAKYRGETMYFHAQCFGHFKFISIITVIVGQSKTLAFPNFWKSDHIPVLQFENFSVKNIWNKDDLCWPYLLPSNI